MLSRKTDIRRNDPILEGRKTMNKKFLKFTAGAVAVMLAAAESVPVYAAKSALTAKDFVNAIHENDLLLDKNKREDDELTPTKVGDRSPVVDASALPSKFDLRDVDGKNFVSPVKDQSPFGTCWSFGATAAAETSIAYAKDHDYNAETGSEEDNLYDLSEKQLAWFAYTALPQDVRGFASQAGEGYHLVGEEDMTLDERTSLIYNIGGGMNYATTVYSAGMGPELEAIMPYAPTTDKEYPCKLAIGCNVGEDGSVKQEDVFTNYYYGGRMTDDEIAAEWTEKGYEPADFNTVREIYNFVVQGGTNLPDYTGEGEKLFTVIDPVSLGDWTIDEDMRFLSFYYLKDGNLLPSPASEGENGAYVFNQTGVDAIKSELVNGRAVSIAFKADQSQPGETLSEDGDRFMNFVDKDGNFINDRLAEYWTHYTYDVNYDPDDKNSVNSIVEANHAVCIIGYDDDFPKEYFRDPKGTLGGNGAFLVKNSWGKVKYDDDGNITSTWGNAGTGCFWLSYYDQSLILPESFEFDMDNDDAVRNIDMYDFVANFGDTSVDFDSDVYMANVFTAQNNCSVRFIGLETAEAGTDVEDSVYILYDGATSPVDGVCVATANEHFNYAGYHTVDLGKTCYIGGGMKYSVVVKASAGDKSSIFFNELINPFGYSEEDLRDVNGTLYINAVVNPGESFIGTSLDDANAWSDWSDIISELKTLNADLNDDSFEYDNFAIRSYPQTEAITVMHFHDDLEKDTYKVGETITGVIIVENNGFYKFDKEDELKLYVTIGQSDTEHLVAEIKKLGFDQTKTYTYKYTVTEKDAAAGELTSTVKVKMMGEDLNELALFDETYTYTVNVLPAESDTDAAVSVESESPDKNPATGTEVFSVAILAGAAAAVAFVSRKRR